jgi:Alpha/beta hydrolase family
MRISGVPARAGAARPSLQSSRSAARNSSASREPWPLDAWPDTPTRYLLCRDDRMFPAAWARRHAREGLGIDADEIDGGHYVSLSRPPELAERLVTYGRSGVVHPSHDGP